MTLIIVYISFYTRKFRIYSVVVIEHWRVVEKFLLYPSKNSVLARKIK